MPLRAYAVLAAAVTVLALTTACGSDHTGAAEGGDGGRASAGGGSGSSGAGGGTSVAGGAATDPQSGPPAGYADGHAAVPTEGQAEDVSTPMTVVGTGTPASCTSDAFVSAVAKGGIITFDCGPDP